MSSRTYTGTKAYALRGTLLERTFVQKLAESATLEELVNRLRGTPYSGVLSGLSPPFTARRLETALRERLAVVHHSMMSTARKYRILEIYYLQHIAWDLKLALKSRALGRTYEETAEYLDMKAEELVGRRDLIAKVLSARDVNEAVSLLSGSEFSSDVEKALNAYASRAEVRFFDLYIDHAILSRISKEYTTNYKLYASSRATDVAGVGDIVTLDVDSYNVLSVLRSKLWGLPEQEIRGLVVTPTYRVTSSVLTRMVGAESVSEAAKLVEAAYPAPGQSAQGDEQLIDVIEGAFSDTMRKTASNSFVWQGLSPGSALAIVKLLELEVRDIAAIAVGVEAGIDSRGILARLRM